jgi:hypothetical protein
MSKHVFFSPSFCWHHVYTFFEAVVFFFFVLFAVFFRGGGLWDFWCALPYCFKKKLLNFYFATCWSSIGTTKKKYT